MFLRRESIHIFYLGEYLHVVLMLPSGEDAIHPLLTTMVQLRTS